MCIRSSCITLFCRKMGGTLQPDTPLPAMLVARSNDPTPAREVTRQPLADVKEKLMRKECCAACSSFSNHLRACPCYRGEEGQGHRWLSCTLAFFAVDLHDLIISHPCSLVLRRGVPA